LVADETIEDKEVAISENEKKISGDLFNKAEKAESTNIEIAVDLYIESGEKGNSEAYMSLGYIYLNGKEGVRKNKTRALKYFREAELLGNEFAQKAIEKIKSEEKNSDKRN
jgi:TPR repeat protein